MKLLRQLLLLALCSAVPALAPANDSRPAVSAEPAVVLYAAQWCGYCAKARDYLADKGIAYHEIDIDDDAGRVAYARASGAGRGIPLLVVHGRQVRGFSATTYDSLFARR